MAKAYSATAVAPGPTSRRTRSQSAQPQQAAHTRTTRSRQSSAEPRVATAKSDARNSNAQNAAKELPTVDENGIGEEDEDEANAEDQVEAHTAEEERNVQTRRTSIGSAFSGTTAKTSFSQEEINKLDPDVICDVLPDALTAADRLAQLLLPSGLSTPPETWKEIKRTGSKHNKLYSTRWDSLCILRPILTSVEYVEPTHVLRALLKVQSVADVQPAAWRPDNILYKINMALMLRAVLVLCDPSDWTEDATGALESLDMAFPECIAGGKLDFYALQLWLEIAAHVTIRRLDSAIDSGASFSPHEEIDNVFNDGNEEFKHYKAFGFLSASEDDRERGMDMVEQRLTLLKAPFGQDGIDATASNGHLKTQFRWDDFRSNTLRYYGPRAEEVDRHIEAAGGVGAIVKGLEQEADRVASEKMAERMKQEYTMTSTASRQSLGGKSAMALLKGREKQIMQQQPAPVAVMSAPASPPQGEDVIIHDFGAQQALENYSEAQEHEEPELAPQSTAQQAVARLNAAQRQNAKKEKARLIDRQANAERISSNMFEDSQPETTSSTAPKRTHAEMEDEAPDDFEPTQDAGFENKVRDYSNAAQRRAEVAFQQATQRVPQRSVTTASQGSPGAGTGPSRQYASTQPSPAKRQRKNPGASIPPPRSRLHPEDPEVPSSEYYRQAKEDAAYNRVSSTQRRPAQIRQPWTDVEESALIDLIVDHVDEEESISYSSLKAIDRSLEETGEAKLMQRSAEDIRFKARNMKLTLLLADRRLPRNWDKVVLDRKAIAKLHSRGIAYQQMRIRASRRHSADAPSSPNVGVSYTTGGEL